MSLAGVVIHKNVVQATHGETIEEVLGSGEASLPHQSFPLTRMPLLTSSENVIEVRVDGVRWAEVPSLGDHGPHDRVFTVEVAGGKASVRFGDGKRGARLPTGTRNVTATYRIGVGGQGDVDATETSNPNRTESGMDPPKAPHL